MTDHVMVQAISQEMAAMQLGNATLLRIVLWVVSAPFYGLGWLVGFLWRMVLWCVAALRVGWRDGRGQ